MMTALLDNLDLIYNEKLMMIASFTHKLVVVTVAHWPGLC